MKKYLLLIEDEALWEKFKDSIDKDINTEIISLIEKKINSKNSPFRKSPGVKEVKK